MWSCSWILFMHGWVSNSSNWTIISSFWNKLDWHGDKFIHYNTYNPLYNILDLVRVDCKDRIMFYFTSCTSRFVQYFFDRFWCRRKTGCRISLEPRVSVLNFIKSLGSYSSGSCVLLFQNFVQQEWNVFPSVHTDRQTDRQTHTHTHTLTLTCLTDRTW